MGRPRIFQSGPFNLSSDRFGGRFFLEKGMADRTIEVRPDAASGSARFRVKVREPGGETRHQVSVSPALCQRIGDGRTPEQVVEAAFRFLLDREPKEAILSRFDISVISRYFPEFECELPHYLATAGGAGDA
jgi:hypothetical protein